MSVESFGRQLQKKHLQQPTKSPTVLGGHLKNAKHVCGGERNTPTPRFLPVLPMIFTEKHLHPTHPSPGSLSDGTHGFLFRRRLSCFHRLFGWPMSFLVFREGCGQQILNNYTILIFSILTKKISCFEMRFHFIAKELCTLYTIWVKQLHLFATRQKEKQGRFFHRAKPLT